MNTNIDITPIIEAVITLIAAVITVFIIPWIKSKVSTAKLQNLKEWAALGVNAAEALYKGTKLGKDKREYVEKYLKDLCEKNGYKYNDVEIRIALEDAWRNMTKEMSEDKTVT